MLSQFVTAELFAFLLVFCRLGSALMLLPGFGELYVASRIRLMLALMFSLLLSPTLQLPPVPATVPAMFILVISEVLTGLFIGAIARMLISTMHMAGGIIAYQSSLSSALTADIAGLSAQDTSLGNFLSMTAVVLLFVTDLHHVMLKGLAESYLIFQPGLFPMIEDFSQHATKTIASAFDMAMHLAAPNIVIGMMLYLGAGILSRLMPNMQIFFIMMAPQLLISFFILMVTISAIMLWYMDFLRESFRQLLFP